MKRVALSWGCLLATQTLVSFLAAMSLSSCGKADAPTTAERSPVAETRAADDADTSPIPPVAAGPGSGEKVCFECNGSGSVACRAPGCRDGKVDCPGGCLKLSKGTWTHMAVDGHSPKELWITFPTAGGGSHSWNQNHVGEVVAYQNGRPVNIGRCKVCGGTTTVVCPTCKGTGQEVCPVCSGKKFIPVGWTSTDNPQFNSQPDLIRLNDGRVILGRVAASGGDELTIVTRDKKIVHVKASEVLARPDSQPH